MRRLIVKICIIWQSPDSNYGRTKLYMHDINKRKLIILRKEVA